MMKFEAGADAPALEDTMAKNKAIEQEEPQDTTAPGELVTMTKDCQTIDVCPGQIPQHEALGWVVV